MKTRTRDEVQKAEKDDKAKNVCCQVVRRTRIMPVMVVTKAVPGQVAAVPADLTANATRDKSRRLERNPMPTSR
jgi:hypothetical protein